MFQGFKNGAAFTITGIQFFLQNRTLWKYSIIPFLLICVIYGLLITGGMYFASDLTASLQEWCKATLPSWLQWLYNLSAFLIYLSVLLLTGIIVMITGSTTYEIIGGPFLDAMLEKFQTIQYGLPPVKKRIWFDLTFAINMAMHGLGTLLLTLLIWLLTLFFPYITLPLSVLLLGFRVGTSSLAIAGYSRGLTLPETQKIAAQNFHLVRGYGMFVFILMFFVPLLVPILLPGILLGGALLLHECQNQLTFFS